MPSIYALSDPRTGEVRYVGKANRPERRLTHHFTPRNLVKRTLRNSWLRQLRALGLRPTLSILEVVAEDAWAEAEQRWIRHYREQGAKLTNMTDGGEGMQNPTASTRAKLSAAAKGHTPWNKGKKMPGLLGSPSEATRRKISEARKGQRPSDYAIARSVEVHTGRPSWNKGVTLRPETKDKLARDWVIFAPDGTEYRVRNLNEFCRVHGLQRQNMHAVASGRRKHSQGWRCQRV